MAAYEETERMIGYMPFVKGHDDTLRKLGDWWQKITLIGKINSQDIAATLLTDMEATKRKFEELQAKLVANLVHENLRKIEREAAARAQVAIDILIRNLFERTADVGFLATDDDLRTFLRLAEADPGAQAAVVERLREYTLKYSVYDEIVVLDPEGRVRAHLDPANPIVQSRDPLIARTLSSGADYVETFGHSDLQPGRRHSLIYSCPIRESDDHTARVLGVLCLCFRFAHEMEGIFANLRRNGELVAILDQEGRVIASSDEKHLPLATAIAPALHEGAHVVRHGGRDYLAKTARTKGYQGYYGLGWMGHMMLPLDTAFEHRAGNGELDAALLHSSRLFSHDLRTISHTAATVTDDLILVVLNGQIISAKKDAAEFMPVLDEIRNIGHQTKAVFDTSIANLHDTVVSALLGDVQFQAFLAVDIMDRNLYERANDVRWWALTTRFRELLAGGRLGGAEAGQLSAILGYINNLYTVYSNLFIYDMAGTIVAVSNPGEAHQVGRQIGGEPPVTTALGLRDSQRYCVSPFAATPLYGDLHTYVYHTSIRALDNPERVVGGIGIVFDGAPQFEAMLRDALPHDGDGNPLEGAFALFVERKEGRVIASSDPRQRIGERIALEPGFVALEPGGRASALLDHDGQRYAVGAAMSQGYREYKTSGDYENDVLGLVFVAV